MTYLSELNNKQKVIQLVDQISFYPFKRQWMNEWILIIFYNFFLVSQENKIKKYRHRLIKLGQTVTDDEESEEEIDNK